MAKIIPSIVTPKIESMVSEQPVQPIGELKSLHNTELGQMKDALRSEPDGNEHDFHKVGHLHNPNHFHDTVRALQNFHKGQSQMRMGNFLSKLARMVRNKKEE